MANKKLNIVTTNEQEPKKRGKETKLNHLTTNKINAPAPAPRKEQPPMDESKIISTNNIEKHQAKNRMEKARAAKRIKK